MSEAFSVHTQPLYRAREVAICLKLSLCVHSHSIGTDVAVCLKLSLCIHSPSIGPEMWLYV